MLNSIQRRRRLPLAAATAVVVAVLCIVPVSVPSAQRASRHFNPMVEKLAHGEIAAGVSTGNFTIENGRNIARSGVDFVYLDMEHGVMSIEVLRNFMMAMIDPATAAKTGHPGPNVAVYARFPPDSSEQTYWVSKQALDMGLMGVLFNGIDTKEQALRAVQSMRYPQKKGSAYYEPIGQRGHGFETAQWFWGIDDDFEYMDRADVYPLNPQGDLLALMMIESEEGVKNIDEIASVPGVSIYLAAGSDLSLSLGVGRNTSAPEVEVAKETIMATCRRRNLICGGSLGAKDITTRVKQGFKFINGGGPVQTVRATAKAAQTP